MLPGGERVPAADETTLARTDDLLATISPTMLAFFRKAQRALVVGGVGAMSRFGLERWSFLVQPEVYFETPARWSGVHDINSGRTSLIATAGMFVLPAPGWQIHVLAKVPYHTWSQGGQLRWPFVALLGFSYTFDMKP